MNFSVALLLAFAACVVVSSPVDEAEPIAPNFDAFRDCRLFLTTRENRGNPTPLIFQDINSISQSTFRRDRPLRVSTHGWGADENDGTHHSIAPVLLDRGDFNFIFLDWSAGAQTGINYLTARNRVPSVGAFLAAYLDWLHLNNLVDYSQTTMVGFSLGAHVVGMAGKQTQRGKIGSIIGLDTLC